MSHAHKHNDSILRISGAVGHYISQLKLPNSNIEARGEIKRLLPLVIEEAKQIEGSRNVAVTLQSALFALLAGNNEVAIHYLRATLDHLHALKRGSPDFLPRTSHTVPADSSEIVVLADLDAAPASLVAELMASLDEMHRALGGNGLEIRSVETGSSASAGVSV